MGNAGWLCCCRKRDKNTIVLLLLGLDNAGKTVAAKGLAGESLDSVVPTVGFSLTQLNYSNYLVKIYDLGGSPGIRGIWSTYFVDAHGVIFVIDSTDIVRLDEVKETLKSILSNKKISGKPVLLLANKQDNEEALDEIDLTEKLNLESLVNLNECPTLVESCTATEINKTTKIDPGIKRGYEWIVNYVIRNYKQLNERVEYDAVQQKINESIFVQESLKNRNGSVGFSKPNSINGVISDRGDSKSGRPKSAVELVRRQLSLNENKKVRKSHGRKTAPVNLYGASPASRSASFVRKKYKEERTVHSAESSLVLGKSLRKHSVPDVDC